MNDANAASRPSQLIERRKLAARLLEAVLDEEITAQVALNRWPYANPESPLDESDLSLEIAYQALWHFEADEIQQQTEPFYMDVQWTLLKQMADTLALGQTLPTHILEAYTPEHQARFYFSQPIWQSYLLAWRRKVGRLYQSFQTLVTQAWHAIRLK